MPSDEPGSHSPRLQVQLPPPLTTSLLYSLHPSPYSVGTYFYFSLNYCQRCHKCQRQRDSFVLKFLKEVSCPSPPGTGPPFLGDTRCSSLLCHQGPLKKAAAATAAKLTHPFARQHTNVSSQKVRPKFPSRMRSNTAIFHENHI